MQEMSRGPSSLGGTTVNQNISSKDAAVSTDRKGSNDLNTISRSDTDLELVKRAQQGDAEAFAALFHAHKARVYSICVRMTNNTAQAEDLTQDAFLQVFRKLSTFKGNSALSTWLYRIAVNTVLMHFRKKALKQVSLDEPSSHDAKQVRREYGSRDGRLTGSVDRIALTRAIKDLPAGYRRIFLLHEVEGYEHQEIADLLDCSVGNSKSQLHKAKLRIREFLTQPEIQSVRVEAHDATQHSAALGKAKPARPAIGFAETASAVG
jgi:RNA polymerase sigma-70 factor (ECF subfamily)